MDLWSALQQLIAVSLALFGLVPFFGNTQVPRPGCVVVLCVCVCVCVCVWEEGGLVRSIEPFIRMGQSVGKGRVIRFHWSDVMRQMSRKPRKNDQLPGVAFQLLCLELESKFWIHINIDIYIGCDLSIHVCEYQ